RPLGPASATASSRNSSSSAASPCAWTHASKCWRVVVIPASIGSTRCAGAGPAPFFACVRCALAVLFVIGGSLAPVGGPFVLVDAILTPTREPSLLSSQVQQGPGHLRRPCAIRFRMFTPTASQRRFHK